MLEHGAQDRLKYVYSGEVSMRLRSSKLEITRLGGCLLQPAHALNTLILRFRKLVSGTDAAEIAEAALVLPIVFMMLLGIYWFGRALNTYETINHAAIEATRVVTFYSCATCGNTLSPGNAGPVVQQVLQASALDPNLATVIPLETVTGCGGGNATCQQITVGSSGTICVYADVQMNSYGGACGMSVSFQYPYQFYFPFTSLDLQKLELKARVQMRGEF